jgi:hypothetical protein
VKAANRVIADAEESASLRPCRSRCALRENKELAEIIAVCIRETALPQLHILKRLLDQQGEGAAVLHTTSMRSYCPADSFESVTLSLPEIGYEMKNDRCQQTIRLLAARRKAGTIES